MTVDTNASNVSGSNGSVNADNRTTVHEAAVAEIVGMISAKYTEEGKRSFDIGKRAFEHAQWQKGNFPGYVGGDFDALMRRIRDDVRMYVSIKAESIRVADWVRCYVLRELVREVIGDHADTLSMFEYLAIVGKALTFSSKDVEGSLNEGWVDMIRGVAFDRSKENGRVTREDFEGRVASTVKMVAEAKANLDPAAAAAKVASDAVKASAKAVSKANENITTALSDGLAAGHISGEGALSILETVAKHHGVALPAAFGFDPANCTIAECEQLATVMFQAGKFAEMVALRDKLDKMVSAVEKARAASNAKQDTAAAPVGKPASSKGDKKAAAAAAA